jgi:hypothetical protein
LKESYRCFFFSTNIFHKMGLLFSYNFVSLSDNLLIFDFLVSSSQELNRLDWLLLTLDTIFLMDLYKLGFKLKLNKISNRRHHYISSTSFLNNPQSNTNPNPRSIYER